MRFSLKTLLWGILLIAGVMVVVLTMRPRPVDVEWATATIGPLKVTVQEDGKTRIRERYTVSAPVSGRVSRIELNPGDRCTESTLLAVILPSDPAILDARAKAEALARVQAARAARERARSAVEQAEIRYELNVAQFERAEKLVETKAISRDEFEIAKTERLASAQAIETATFDAEIASFELEMAEAAVSQFADTKASPSVDPFEIYSPISGRVLRVIQESSAVVAVGTPLIELGDPQNLEIEVDVLSTDAVRIRPGAELTVQHWGGQRPLSGYVRVIEPQAFTKVSSLGVEEQRVNVIADFNEPPERLETLGDSYRVEASITVEQLERALLIPNSALFRHQRRWHVLAIEAGRAVLRPLKVGLRSESHTEVLKGIVPGERVIIYPDETLRPGTAVRPVSRSSGATG